MDNLQASILDQHSKQSDQSQALVDQLDQIAEFSGSEHLIHELSHLFEFFEYQLGDLICSPSEDSETQKEEALDIQDIYVLCRGKVRLLSFDRSRPKQVSIQLLTACDIFGGDAYAVQESLPYQAIAASEVKVAKISGQQLQPWLAKLPRLKEKWLATVNHRQKLIFFKTLPLFDQLTTFRLEKFCAYLREKRIPPGVGLDQFISQEPGHYWLRVGQIQGQNTKPGFSWGYPESSVIQGVTQTEIWVYYLPQEDWEPAIAIIPELTVMLQGQSQLPFQFSSPEHLSSNSVQSLTRPRRITRLEVPHPSELRQRHQMPRPSAQTSEVDFPRPLKSRHRVWRAYPFIEQQSSSDCGTTCLATISLYWGKRFGLNWLREISGVGRSGSSLKNLAKTAETLGYQARPVRASLNRLVDQKNPWIAHWEGNHFIVVYWIRGNRVLVADPAKGKYRLSRQAFLEGWTGFALLLDPTEQLYAISGEKRSLGRFLNLLSPYRSLGLQIIVASILIQIFGMVSPLFTQIILDQIVVSQSQTTLNVMAIGALLFGICGIGLSSVRSYLLSYFANRLDLTMISGFIKHTLNLPLKFFESRRVGDIITRVHENQKIQQFLIGQVLLSWLNLISGFVYLCLMLYYNWQLTVLVLGIIPPIFILTLVATPLLRQISRERFNASADQSSSLVEMLSGISTVKSVAGEQELRWRWEDKLTQQLNVRFKGQKLAINLGLLSGLINTIGKMLLLWYGATLVIQEHLTIGQFVAFNMMSGHVISPVIALVGLWDELQEVLISVERLNDVFDSQPEEAVQHSTLLLPTIRGDVQFENVTFRYDSEEERNALQNISFEVKQGQTLAVVGRSGSGKSTLVKLLQGLYYPTSGQIWIDGHDIKHLSLQTFRPQLGVVPQECFLFSGTILENITLHRPQFSLEQVIATAKLAEAHAFIQAMPLGYNTKVGEWGTNLSGGQRQRIAIARALLGEPPILILDEATSSLDTESERRFQDNLGRLARERTTIIIAHRLSTVRNANCILVLDKGSLVEKGTHNELIDRRGLYYHLAQQQLNL